MSNSIRLSKKNGLNPTIPVCWYCGEPKNEIMLLGAAGDKVAKSMGRPDGDMPMHVRVAGDFKPCDACAAKGVGIVEVAEDPDGKRRPTGRSWLVKDDALRFVNDEKLKADILEKRVCLIPPEVAKAIGLYGVEEA